MVLLLWKPNLRGDMSYSRTPLNPSLRITAPRVFLNIYKQVVSKK